jgi:phage-related protein (TIGR01555 family)
MSKVRAFLDRLTNVMSGMGTTADRRVYSGYNFTVETPAQVESAYRSSWLMRKIVDVPAMDMTRAWRSWQTERDIIEQLEKEEKRLQLKSKVKRALVLARLWGGGVIVMGVKGQGNDPMQPIAPDRVTKGGLEWLHVFARHEITTGQMISDPTDPWFGHPERYEITPTHGRSIPIHPSRVIAFIGQPAPEGSTMQADWFWGDPLYQSIRSALQNADLAQDGFASLIDEAKVDIVKMPELMEKYSTAEYEDRLLARLQAASMGKSAWRTLLLDGEEDWQQRQITWAGMPDIITSYLQIVAGAADIPVTRLLGQSPKGLQSTGEGEEKDYHAMIEARQDEILCPALDRIDELLIRSALGSRPEDIWYRFNPLMRLSPKDAMQIEKDRAATIKVYSDTGLLPTDALAEITKNAITESGQWPGSEIAFENAEDDPLDEGEDGTGTPPEDDPEAMREVMTPEEIDAMDRRKPRRIMDAQLADARPRSLYVSRKVVNADDLIAWAKAQGFKTTQPASELHVTIAFSRKPVDWMAVGDDWSSDPDGLLRVKPGGPRLVEPLGDKGAVVLLFRNDSLEYRHERIHSESVGASWDFPEYQPHITITWDGKGIDLANVEPYKGPIVLGPEIFAEVVDDWEKTITEE